MILGQYNIKVLTEENWLNPDPLVGDKKYYYKNKWVSTVLRARLRDNVPPKVKEQFGLAQSVILYGYFFAPLCLVGLRECYRVAEFAIDYKFTILDIEVKRKDFESKINELAERSIVFDKERWHTIRKERNNASHLVNPDNYFYNGTKNDFDITDPEKKLIYLSPNFVLYKLGDLMHAIDSLFADNDQAINL